MKAFAITVVGSALLLFSSCASTPHEFKKKEVSSTPTQATALAIIRSHSGTIEISRYGQVIEPRENVCLYADTLVRLLESAVLVLLMHNGHTLTLDQPLRFRVTHDGLRGLDAASEAILKRRQPEIDRGRVGGSQ